MQHEMQHEKMIILLRLINSTSMPFATLLNA
jgi:hypothetical protein